MTILKLLTTFVAAVSIFQHVILLKVLVCNTGRHKLAALATIADRQPPSDTIG